MSNPTSNFGWQMPTNTDLVTNLPADFEVFGQAVDSDFADLKGGTSGQILSKASATDLDFTWITNDVGDITAVTAGTGISGGGTSGSVTITNSMATTITTNGDTLYGTGSGTFTRLGIGSAGQVLTVASGVPSWASPSGTALPAFSAYNGSNQSFSASTYTKIQFPTEDFDTAGNFASNRFTPTTAGYYQVSTGVRFSASTANGWYFLLYKNGTSFRMLNLIEGPDVFRYPMGQASALVYMNGSTDYLEIYCAFDATSPTTLGGSSNVYFTGVGVRA